MLKNSNPYFALFYLENNYFLPHFTSVLDELKDNSLTCAIVIPEEKSRNRVKQNKTTISYCEKNFIEYVLLPQEGLVCEYLFFGNAIHPTGIDYKQTVSIFHGCWGGKNVYLRNELTEFDIRYVETEFIRENILRAHPDKKDNMVTVGYTKLDSMLKIDAQAIEESRQKYGLDPAKKTILYAPTFYPSSIRKIPADFPEVLSDFNIIVKPHFYIYMRERYGKELELIETWNQYENVYFADLSENSLIPFMHVADLLVSDLSAAIYEFAAMGKPVVVNRFVNSRWYYKLMPNKLNKRLDLVNFDLWEVGDNAYDHKQMIRLIKENLDNSSKMAIKRQQLVEKVVGVVDGKVAERIVKHLKNNIS
ncbi:MAG: CDP-glycerol glycerophosphotransferase family protein [Marinifilaceae bacterium]